MKGGRNIVFGAHGYVGSHLIKDKRNEKWNFLTAGRRAKDDFFVDLGNLETFKNISFRKGDKVVFLSAISSPDICSKEYEVAYRVNVESTLLVISKALEAGAHVLFSSSDVVYGEQSAEVDENHKVNPSFEYAEMKARVEEEFQSDLNFKVMRLSYVWSLRDKFTQYVLAASAKSEEISIFHPFKRSIVYLENVLDFICAFISDPNMLPNVTNLCGPSCLSRVDLIELLSQSIPIDYVVTYPESDFFERRPKEINMKSVRLENVLGKKPTSIKEAIQIEFKR